MDGGRMINKGIEVGSTVELDPKFDKQERTKGRLQWLKAKKLCFGARYIVVESLTATNRMRSLRVR